MLDDLAVAHLCADAADRVTARFFTDRNFEVITKDDGTPVTIADLQTEQAVCAVLSEHRPNDGVLGEEVGPSGPQTRRWILDGIDGTHNFVAGRTEWATMIALQDDGEVVVGVVTSSVQGRRWWAARGQGAWTATTGGIEHPGDPALLGKPERLSVSTTTERDGAIISTMPGTSAYKGWKLAAAQRVEQGDVRSTSFAHAAVRVASGVCDAMVCFSGGPWDFAAGVPLVEEAGGRWLTFWGGREVDTRSALMSNPYLFDGLFADLQIGLPAAPEPRQGSWTAP